MGDICSSEDDSASDYDIISPMSEKSMSDSEATVSDDDAYINRLDVYTGVCPKCQIMY